MTLYKVTNKKGRPVNGGSGQYSLPVDGVPGDWMPDRQVIPCESGYHLCDGEAQLLEWLGETVWVAEGRGTRMDADDKVVFESARLVAATAWNETTARLFAAECAERVLHIFEAENPADDRPRKAIETARRYAHGNATQNELAAARDAAWSAAWSAARDAAESAAQSTAWSAAESAARDAAWYAAESAAWSAAESAAQSAAQSTARSAAWYAARYDARPDPAAAAREWQAERLGQYLRGEIN